MAEKTKELSKPVVAAKSLAARYKEAFDYLYSCESQDVKNRIDAAKLNPDVEDRLVQEFAQRVVLLAE
jgi:hypothetical protein